jgi:SpoVK/Ycf46/Vps4 family AAA+-type ATPase
MVKRLYIPLPDANARRTIVLNLLRHNQSKISEDELQLIVQRTDGYSGSDLKALCEDAGLGTITMLGRLFFSPSLFASIFAYFRSHARAHQH